METITFNPDSKKTVITIGGKKKILAGHTVTRGDVPDEVFDYLKTRPDFGADLEEYKKTRGDLAAQAKWKKQNPKKDKPSLLDPPPDLLPLADDGE